MDAPHKSNPTNIISEEKDDTFQRNYVSQAIVLQTVERIKEIKKEFANEDCEMFMPIWAMERYLNILNRQVPNVEAKCKSPNEETHKEETGIRHAQ